MDLERTIPARSGLPLPTARDDTFLINAAGIRIESGALRRGLPGSRGVKVDWDSAVVLSLLPSVVLGPLVAGGWTASGPREPDKHV